MKRVRYARWYLPPTTAGRKPYLSRWKMSDEDAAANKAVRIDEASIEWRDLPETPEEMTEAMRRTNTAPEYKPGDLPMWKRGRTDVGD